ncbi:MAG: glutamate 5-kinase [Candidatus Scalindua sp. AMX11]|nr:MAG: glutamate 5-kinase [Candidatus Scalindua sp.]NOG82266.1 glutamate 5-kinase [Planctomycetota bacterium]RZV71442.1 MAG: glutamate 5-kinase [Candidatus Scalindua sp. SCAELEC01]TDE64294.1 MAG: glutamate 5-kinase [Candidatus Scalindua sp. AMX11]GJQ59934.1 MAG: glutamate 5-kinase [Candidatus Scalindua sp.]
MNIRKETLSKVNKIVVKIGTHVLTNADGILDNNQIMDLSRQIILLCTKGYKVVVVTSGAIGAGISAMGRTKRPTILPELQAAAAIGQGKLMEVYNECFKSHGYHAAQLLLTRQDFEDRQRYLNTSNTLHTLLRFKTIPIVNENDTIAIDEIAFGDNDVLSAMVTNLLHADLLILLSSIDGLYTKPPKTGQRNIVVPIVDEVSDDIKKLAFKMKTRQGTGGMESKLKAAGDVTNAGEAAIIANGKHPDILQKIVNFDNVGTLFLPSKKKIASRKRWIGFSVRPNGKIFIDEGACDALHRRGKSLLPSGLVNVVGNFVKGDIVSIMDTDGDKEVARGLINYSKDEVLKIKGMSTSLIKKTLGAKPYDEVIHRDNMVLL